MWSLSSILTKEENEIKRRNTTKHLKTCIGKSSLFKAIIGLNNEDYKFQRNYQATPINEFNLVNLKII